MTRVLKIAAGGAAGLVALVVIAAAAVWVLRLLDEPAPVEQLLTDDATIDLADYRGSMPESDDRPAILILGSAHLAQADYGFTATEYDQVTQALARFGPDLVAVEYLPPDWPDGRGRDYRPELDLDAYAASWDMTIPDAQTRVERARNERPRIEQPCMLGRAHLLTGDLVNAYYVWDSHGCDEPTADADLADWWRRMSEHELARIAAPVARASDVNALTSFDDQGKDTQWFLQEEVLTFEAVTSPRDLWHMLPAVNPRTRQFEAHIERHDDRLVDLLDHLNSPERIGLQYWAYEQMLPGIEVDDVGQRQLDSYWTRNQRMFERLDEAVAGRDAERVLVVVGAGHKYFLDELARDHGYRWIDPREWLPDPSGHAPDGP